MPNGMISMDGGISIHPSRVGWDILIYPAAPDHLNFNPPIPCGMGHVKTEADLYSYKFQSTHPVWDGTFTSALYLSSALDFNPPIPCGMGRSPTITHTWLGAFQSTHPVWDGTSAHDVTAHIFGISIHPSRVGWDSKKYMITYISCDSYPFCQIFRLHKMTAYSYS